MNSNDQLMALRMQVKKNLAAQGRQFPRMQGQFDIINALSPIPPVAASGGGGGGGVTPPLWLVKADSSNVNVAFGTVNGLTPTGIATNIDVSGTDATWAIYMHLSLDGDGNPTAAAVESADTGIVPSDDGTNAYRLIGQVTVSSGAITVVSPAMAWSQEFIACVAGDPTSYNWVVS